MHVTHSGLTHQTLHEFAAHVCYMQCTGQLRLPMLIQPYLLQLGHACDPQWAYSPNTAWVCYMQCTGHSQKVTKLPVLFQPYSHVYDISVPDSFM